MSNKFYVVFDGPPGPEGPRFVEVENEQRQSVRVGEWVPDTKTAEGYWRLGPFQEYQEPENEQPS